MNLKYWVLLLTVTGGYTFVNIIKCLKILNEFFFEQIKMVYIAQTNSDSPRTRCAPKSDESHNICYKNMASKTKGCLHQK